MVAVHLVAAHRAHWGSAAGGMGGATCGMSCARLIVPPCHRCIAACVGWPILDSRMVLEAQTLPLPCLLPPLHHFCHHSGFHAGQARAGGGHQGSHGS